MKSSHARTARNKLDTAENVELLGIDPGLEDEEAFNIARRSTFSFLDYCLCIILGIGILWTWQAILGAAPYFRLRFESEEWVAHHYESTIFAVFAIVMLAFTIQLTRNRAEVRYQRRVYVSLLMYIFISLLLALSTVLMLEISNATYFAFVLIAAGGVGIANALSQNGVFALVSGLGEPRYAQGVLLGSALAGISPPVSQIITVIWDAADRTVDDSSSSPKTDPLWPLVYFIFSSGVGVTSLIAFGILMMRHRSYPNIRNLTEFGEGQTQPPSSRERQSLKHTDFFRESHCLAVSLFICFTITTCSPVFSSKVQSVLPVHNMLSFSQPTIFVPLALLVWNCGEFLGSFVPLLRSKMVKEPKFIFVASVARVGFIFLYNLCNVEGRGAIFGGDIFYLVVVQFLSGLTSGWLMTACMMGPADYPNEGDREDAGAFMVLYLIAGLAAGSLLSFAVA